MPGGGILNLRDDTARVAASPEISGETTRAPRLALEKTGWLKQFASSVAVLVQGPAPPKKFLGAPYFRDCWIEQGFPKLAFAAAVALQILLIVFPPPIWNIHPARIVPASPDMELTWFGPVKDFPAIHPTAPALKSPPVDKPAKAPARRGADAFHSRQTILSEPLHPTHPRQTLLQPSKPPAPPKILPALPNIVRLADSQPARPELHITAMRPKLPAHLAAPSAAVPDVTLAEKQAGPIDIASSKNALPEPVLPVTPMSRPLAARQKSEANVAAPNLGARTGDSSTLIALSATPAPVAPPPAIPAGNLSARISISPDGSRPGGAAEHGVLGKGPNAEGKHGPEGIFISKGNSAASGPVSGLGIGPTARGLGRELPSRPVPRARISNENTKIPSSDSAVAAPKFGMSPEKLLGAKRVYSLHVNMPNLTSASGSWVLNFAALDDAESPGYAPPDLVGPVPLRKVDPKYPPELRTEHVEGEVILYAIIRKDGSVDSIQLVHSIDPQLDANAMAALAQWKFRPAERRGQPVDLEAVVYVPFRSRGPSF